VGVIILAAGLLALIVTLAALAPEGTPVTTRQWLRTIIPYLIVVLLGVFVGLAELVSTFDDYPMDAVMSGWGLGLIALNGAMAGIVLAIVRAYTPETDLSLLVLGVGVGFQAIIRTRFVLAKEFSGTGGGDLSLNLGWLYEQFQTLCKTQVDQALMHRRQPIVRELVDAFPSDLALFNMAYYTVVARRTFTPEEEAQHLAALTERLEDRALPEEVIRMTIALHILETGGEAHARALISAAKPPARQPPVEKRKAVRSMADVPEIARTFETPGRETITKNLATHLDLDQLQSIALEVVGQKAAGDMRADWLAYVQNTVADVDSPEAVRQTSLARFIVDKAGPAFASNRLPGHVAEEPYR